MTAERLRQGIEPVFRSAADGRGDCAVPAKAASGTVGSVPLEPDVNQARLLAGGQEIAVIPETDSPLKPRLSDSRANGRPLPQLQQAPQGTESAAADFGADPESTSFEPIASQGDIYANSWELADQHEGELPLVTIPARILKIFQPSGMSQENYLAEPVPLTKEAIGECWQGLVGDKPNGKAAEFLNLALDECLPDVVGRNDQPVPVLPRFQVVTALKGMHALTECGLEEGESWLEFILAAERGLGYQDQSFWLALSETVWPITRLGEEREALQPGKNQAYFKGLKQAGMQAHHFLNLVSLDPEAACMLQRLPLLGDLGVQEQFARIVGKHGASLVLGRAVRSRFSERTFDLAKAVSGPKETGEELMQGLQKKLGISDPEEVTRRVQLVSLDRGGRILLNRLHRHPPFREETSGTADLAALGVKVDSLVIALEKMPKANGLELAGQIDGLDMNGLTQVFSALKRHPEKEVIVTCDLDGSCKGLMGFDGGKKYQALRRIFGAKGHTVLTAGYSGCCDLGLRTLDNVVGHDDNPELLGSWARIGDYFVQTSPPCPWHCYTGKDSPAAFEKRMMGR